MCSIGNQKNWQEFAIGPSGHVFAPFGAISHFTNFGSSSKQTEIGPESFGIVVCRFVGTGPDILGLVWPNFRPESGVKSRTYGRILKSCRGPCSSAENINQILIYAFGRFRIQLRSSRPPVYSPRTVVLRAPQQSARLRRTTKQPLCSRRTSTGTDHETALRF